MAKKIYPTDLHVGARVRQQRTSMGLSLAKLAEALGVTHQQIQKYETGVNRISASSLDQISKALGVPAGFFFEGIVDAHEATECTDFISDFLSTAEGVDLAKAFLRVRHAAVRRSIVSIVECIAAAEASEEVAS